MMIALQWNPFPIHHPGAHHGGEVDGGSNHNVICQDVGVTRWAKVLAIRGGSSSVVLLRTQ